jgi:DNA damage-binding protein 1
VTGSIGNIIALSENSFRFFSAVETAMRKIVHPLGGFSHEEWRSFKNHYRACPQRNMIDGDLVEAYLDLTTREDFETAAKEINHEINSFLSILRKTNEKKNKNATQLSSKKAIIENLTSFDEVHLTVEDISRRIEDITRLH